MPIYLKRISSPRCIICDERAEWTLFSTANEPLNSYCSNHALRARDSATKSEREREAGR